MDRNKDIARDFEEATRRYIAGRGMLHPGAPVVVAFSGGADSTALLAVLRALGYECVAAHCNFHLRGDESNRDMHHARQLADALEADCSIRHFDMQAELAAHPAESLEMACRRVRYAWFESLSDSLGAQAIAVGHHSEDRTETFLLNMLRGAGIVGLTSMNAVNGAVVRPLLWATRQQIEEYLSARGLEYVDDSTNFENEFNRNKLRNIVLPELERLFPGASHAIMRSVANLESVRRLYLAQVEQVRAKYSAADGSLDLAGVAALPEAHTILIELLRGKGFTPAQCADMLAASVSSGARFHSTTGILGEIDRGRLTLSYDATAGAVHEAEVAVNLRRDVSEPLRLQITYHRVEEFGTPERDPNVAYLDTDYALSPAASWTVRHWRRGDRMTPFGASMSKLVSDLFADAKYSAAAKRKAWMLVRDGQIVWIPGLRASNLGTVGPRTRRYLRLVFLPDNNNQ